VNRRFADRPYAALYLTFYIFVLFFYLFKGLVIDKILDCLGWCFDKFTTKTDDMMDESKDREVIDYYNEIFSKFLQPLYATSIDNYTDYHKKVEKEKQTD